MPRSARNGRAVPAAPRVRRGRRMTDQSRFSRIKWWYLGMGNSRISAANFAEICQRVDRPIKYIKEWIIRRRLIHLAAARALKIHLNMYTDENPAPPPFVDYVTEEEYQNFYRNSGAAEPGRRTRVKVAIDFRDQFEITGGW